MNLGPLFMFIALTGVFEPSAIQQLPDGRFLVAEDEKTHPFTLLTLRADGTSSTTPLLAPGPDAALSRLDDLEGITTDAVGFVYAITSHSRNADGEEKKSREKLIRFRIEGDRAVAPVVVKNLKAALTAAHPVLAAAAEVAEVKAEGGLNVEGLEMAPDGRRLLLGFRSPLREGRALVAAIENPREIFEAGAAPRISPRLDTLDLGGHGIRGMSWVPALAGYLVISGPVAKERTQFRLWFWSGRPGDAPRRVTVPGLPGFEHAEGVCPAIVDGKPRIVIVSDDGDRKAGRPARFLALEPGQLRIEGIGEK
jgi:hypothetical protein